MSLWDLGRLLLLLLLLLLTTTTIGIAIVIIRMQALDLDLCILSCGVAMMVMVMHRLVQIVHGLQNEIDLLQKHLGHKDKLRYDLGVELSVERCDLDIELDVRVRRVYHMVARQ